MAEPLPWMGWGLLVALAVTGCDRGPSSARLPSPGAAELGRSVDDDVFQTSISQLTSLAEFDTGPSFYQAIELTADPWDAEMLDRLIRGGPLADVIDGLNRWIGRQAPGTDWRPDPLISTLPGDLQELASKRVLGRSRFAAHDAVRLREAVWLRDVADRVCGQKSSDLERAELLFDWTIRNIQLDPRTAAKAPRKKAADRAADGLLQVPWETLILGRGGPHDRSWIFTLLARQQDLDVVMLALANPSAPDGLEQWLPALSLGTELYLFDTRLGLAIPGPEGVGVATLAQAANDDAILRQLDLDSDHRYPIERAQLASVTALIEGSPFFLSRRTAELDVRLAGRDRMVLSLSPSVLAERLRKTARITDVRLWTAPYLCLRAESPQGDRELAALAEKLRPMMVPFEQERGKRGQVDSHSQTLWRARMLHLHGKLTGPTGANHFYQVARPADSEIDSTVRQLQGLLAEHTLQASGLPVVGPPVQRALRSADRRIPLKPTAEMVRSAKRQASYFLGLSAYERGEFDVAIDYFGTRTLEASPNGPWSGGAHYNLGRALEAAGRREEAIAAYREDDSPQQHGNLLRARWLEAGQLNNASP